MTMMTLMHFSVIYYDGCQRRDVAVTDHHEWERNKIPLGQNRPDRIPLLKDTGGTKSPPPRWIRALVSAIMKGFLTALLNITICLFNWITVLNRCAACIDVGFYGGLCLQSICVVNVSVVFVSLNYLSSQTGASAQQYRTGPAQINLERRNVHMMRVSRAVQYRRGAAGGRWRPDAWEKSKRDWINDRAGECKPDVAYSARRMGKGADGRLAADRGLEYGRSGRGRRRPVPCRSLSIDGGQRSRERRSVGRPVWPRRRWE